MEKEQMEIIRQIANQLNALANQVDEMNQRLERVEKKAEQIDVVKEKLEELDIRMCKHLMDINNNIEKKQEINMRQHAEIIELIERRFQEGKEDRMFLHQSQDALNFRVKQLETKSF